MIRLVFVGLAVLSLSACITDPWNGVREDKASQNPAVPDPARLMSGHDRSEVPTYPSDPRTNEKQEERPSNPPWEGVTPEINQPW